MIKKIYERLKAKTSKSNRIKGQISTLLSAFFLFALSTDVVPLEGNTETVIVVLACVLCGTDATVRALKKKP